MYIDTARENLVKVAIRSGRRLFRDALANWLTGQDHFSIVGHVAGTEDLLQLCALRKPDLVLFDAGAAVANALPSLGLLRERFGQIRVVVVYDRLTPAELNAARQIGLETLVPCSHGLPALLVLLRREAESIHATSGAPERTDEVLTDQERKIIALVGAGHTVRRIAELLNSAPGAVENCKRRIYHKLGVASQSQAISRAAALGLIDAAGRAGNAGTRPTATAAAGAVRRAAGTPEAAGSEPGGRWAPGGRPVGSVRWLEDRLPQLTNREADILRSIAMGHTVRQTARLLDIAEKTVENTQGRLFLRLGTRNRAEAIATAHNLGLLDQMTALHTERAHPRR